MIRHHALLLLPALLSACSLPKGHDNPLAITEEVDTTGVAAAHVQRLDLMVADTSVTDVPPALALWLQMNGGATVDQYWRTPAVTMFTPEVARVFPAEAVITPPPYWPRLAQLLGGRPVPQVAAVVIPYTQSVILCGDTLAYLGLNHYLGAEHPAYDGMPAYQRHQKVPERVAIDLTEALLATRWPYTATEPKVVSRMLREGALVEAVMRVTGCSEAQALGYTDEQMAWADAHEQEAWNALLDKKLLFSTDPRDLQRLFDPAPATQILHFDAPGRLGRFLGHRIVMSFLHSNPEHSVASTLLPTFWDDPNTLSRAMYQ